MYKKKKEQKTLIKQPNRLEQNKQMNTYTYI